MESFYYPHASLVAHVALYTDISNASDLRKRIVAAANSTDIERNALNFSFIEARLVTSRLHLQTAIHQAILAHCQGALRTKTINSEILWALNPSNNISEAIRRYGVSESSTALLVVKIDEASSAPESPPDVQKSMNMALLGTIRPMDDLAQLTDWAAVKKYNKLTSESAIVALKGQIKEEQSLVDRIVTSAVAMKSVAV